MIFYKEYKINMSVVHKISLHLLFINIDLKIQVHKLILYAQQQITTY